MKTSILVIYPNHFQTYLQINGNLQSPGEPNCLQSHAQPSSGASMRPLIILQHLIKYKVFACPQFQTSQPKQTQKTTSHQLTPPNVQNYAIYQYPPLTKFYCSNNSNKISKKLTKSLQINDQFSKQLIVEPQLCYVNQIYFILGKGQNKDRIGEYVRQNWQYIIKGELVDDQEQEQQEQQEEVYEVEQQKEKEKNEIEEYKEKQLNQPDQEQLDQQQQEKDRNAQPQQNQQQQILANSSIQTQNYRDHIWRQKLAINAEFRSRIQGRALKQQKYRQNVQKYIPKIQYVTLTFMMDNKLIAQEKIIKFTILRNQLMENYDVYYDRDCNSKLNVKMIMGIKDKVYYVKTKQKLIHNLIRSPSKGRKKNGKRSISHKNNNVIKYKNFVASSSIHQTNFLLISKNRNTQIRTNNISEQSTNYLPCDLLLKQQQQQLKINQSININNHNRKKILKYYTRNQNKAVFQSVYQEDNSNNNKMDKCISMGNQQLEKDKQPKEKETERKGETKNQKEIRIASRNINQTDKVNFKVRKIKKKSTLTKKIIQIQKTYGVSKLLASKNIRA